MHFLDEQHIYVSRPLYAQGVKQDEVEIAMQKLSFLRALGPKAITGDIANLMSQVINASGGNVRRTVVLTFPLLVDKLLEFVDHWAVKVSNAMASSSSSPVKEESHSKPQQTAGSFQIVQSEWQNYDDVERERMIPILQTELKSLRELYQERVDEINSFESRMAELQASAQREAAALQKRLHSVQEEYEGFKQSTTRHHAEPSSTAAATAAAAAAAAAAISEPSEESTELMEQRELVQQLQQDIQGLHAELKHLLREKDLLVQSATQLEEELHSTIMAKEKLSQQATDYKRQADQIPQLETMLTMTNQQKLQMENQCRKTETALKNQEKIVETLAKNLQKKDKEVQRLVQQLDTVQQQLRKTEESLNTLSNEHVALEANVQAMTRSLEELRDCKEALTHAQDELHKKNFHLETELVKSRVDNQNLQDDLGSMTNQKDMLLMALETSQMKLREKIEELEAIDALKKHHSVTATPAAIQHIQQGIVGGVGNIVDYFEQRTTSSVSPVPGATAGSGGAASGGGAAGGGAGGGAAAGGGAGGKPAFPLLKRLSTGITSLTQGQTTTIPAQQPVDDFSDHTALHQPYPVHASGGAGAGGGGAKSHALAASIRSKYSNNNGSSSNSGVTAADYPAAYDPAAHSYAPAFDGGDDDDPSSYAPVPSTRDVDSDDET